jgi:hypothetical protein
VEGKISLFDSYYCWRKTEEFVSYDWLHRDVFRYFVIGGTEEILRYFVIGCTEEILRYFVIGGTEEILRYFVSHQSQNI